MVGENLIKNVYLSSNTWDGFFSLYSEILPKMDRVIILKGGPATGKSTILKTIGFELINFGIAVELIHCSFDTKALDGIIIPKYKIAVVDGVPPHDIEPIYFSLIGEIVNLGEFQDRNMIVINEEKIKILANKMQEYYQKSLHQLQTAKEINYWIEQFYTSGLQHEKASKITIDLIEEIFKSDYEVKDYFIGAFTPKGIINFVSGLTNDCKKRYILKGKPDWIKSQILEKLAHVATNEKLSVEIYRNYLDPEKIDMIIIPQKSLAVLDGLTTHTINPSKQGDYIIDINQVLTFENIEKNITIIKELEEELEQVLNEVKESFCLVEEYYDELKKYYIGATDFEKLPIKRTEILGEIMKEIAKKRK